MTAPGHHRIVIVGAGIAGVGMGVRLRQRGAEDFLILERNDQLGGTWFEHTYPGCACDVPTHLYSYSFARNPHWSRLFPRQEEILGYVNETADRHGVREHIRFACSLEGAEWDEAASRWRLATSDGELTADLLVSAVGGTSEPLDPPLPGLPGFKGHTFHSARWDHAHSLAGERVAVIGTGPATAQFVPRIVGDVAGLDVYQRTPPWVMPHPDRPAPWLERQLYRLAPPVQDAHRNLLFAAYEAVGLGFHSEPAILGPIEALGRRHLRRQVSDPGLREKLTPRYRFGCKRPVLSNTYYPALTRPHVDLVTDPIKRVNARSITTADGTRREVDTIIFGTGYKYAKSEAAARIAGRDGRTLADAWRPSPRAYLGSSVPGFPNMFILLGPNAIGINSAIYSLESQINYALAAMREMERSRAARIEVRPEALEDYAAEVDRRNEGTVWTAGGCRSYYLDEAGHQFALWPGMASVFRWRTRRFDASRYSLA
jgi:cation diffusion facilitator CzcD-associated flavoprotein CzcO